MGNGRVEPIALRGRAEDEPGPRRRPGTIPEIVPASELSGAADDAGVTVDTLPDNPGAFGVLRGRIAKKDEEKETEHSGHERDMAEPCSRKPESLPHIEPNGTEPRDPIDRESRDGAGDHGCHQRITGNGEDDGERSRKTRIELEVVHPGPFLNVAGVDQEGRDGVGRIPDLHERDVEERSNPAGVVSDMDLASQLVQVGPSKPEVPIHELQRLGIGHDHGTVPVDQGPPPYVLARTQTYRLSTSGN